VKSGWRLDFFPQGLDIGRMPDKDDRNDEAGMTDEPKAEPSEESAADKTDAATAEAKADAGEEKPAEAAEPTADPAPAAEAMDDPPADDPPAGDPPSDDPLKVNAGDSSTIAAEEMEAVAKLVEALQSENADLKDKLLRTAAEMENLRRRFEREMADARQYAVTGFAREVLSIGDNLGRAIAAVPEEARSEGATKALLEGVEMTDRELHRVLSKHGVNKIEPEGQKFDPNLHQAMFEVEHDDAPHGTVVQVMQAGYSIGDRVLRPAMVGIAKQKPKAAEEAKPERSESDAEAKADETSAAETADEPKAANDS
jgi:molecular chaperone GrpE